MKLEIIKSAETLDELMEQLEEYFGTKFKVYKEEWSIFEQYQVRPISKFIPQIWSYRIVCKNDQYTFGKTIQE